MNKIDNIQNIKKSIDYLNNLIESDLKELDGDTESDYAKLILDGHIHIKTAIETMDNVINPTHGYAE